MYDVELTMFFVLIMEFIIDMALEFNLVEQPSFQRLVDFLHPNAADRMVKCTTMGDTVLNSRYSEAIRHHDENILAKKAGGHWFGLVVDG